MVFGVSLNFISSIDIADISAIKSRFSIFFRIGLQLVRPFYRSTKFFRNTNKLSLQGFHQS